MQVVRSRDRTRWRIGARCGSRYCYAAWQQLQHQKVVRTRVVRRRYMRFFLFVFFPSITNPNYPSKHAPSTPSSLNIRRSVEFEIVNSVATPGITPHVSAMCNSEGGVTLESPDRLWLFKNYARLRSQFCRNSPKDIESVRRVVLLCTTSTSREGRHVEPSFVGNIS